jgi:hypothetical protein
VLLAIAVIVHSCRKAFTANENTVAQAPKTLSQAELLTLQTIYTQRTNAIAPIGVNATGDVSGNSLIRNMNVKWDKYVINDRDDSSRVVEFDMRPDSGVAVTKQLNAGDPIRFKNKTCAVFIKFSNGKRLNFFMNVIEDYSSTNTSVINDLHYRQIPATFSGQILFYTLDKKYMKGYHYTNGKIAGTIGIVLGNTTSSLQIASTKLKTNLASYEPCGANDVYWVWYNPNNPDDYEELYLYTEYYYCEADNGGDGAPGDTPGNSGGPPSTPPCPGVTTESVRGLRVNVLQGGGDDSGSTDPTDPNTPAPNPCATPPPDTTKIPCDALAAIVALMQSNNRISAQDAIISNKLTSDPNHEWGVDHRINNLTNGSFMPIDPTQGVDATTYVGYPSVLLG